MRIFCATLVVLALIAIDFMSDAGIVKMSAHDQLGWSWADTFGILGFVVLMVTTHKQKIVTKTYTVGPQQPQYDPARHD